VIFSRLLACADEEEKEVLVLRGDTRFGSALFAPCFLLSFAIFSLSNSLRNGNFIVRRAECMRV
jgi:hypothetical protein